MITILCHNIFWLQGVPFLTDQPGEPRREILEALAGLYDRIGPDVICLQEVQGPEAFDLIRSVLGLGGTYCPGRTLQQYGGAVMWRKGRQLLDSSEAADPPQRVWQLVEGGGSNGVVTVCNVHLPSARQLGREKAAARRVQELEAALERRPDVVVGDFNEPPGGGVTDLMTARDYRDAAVESGKGDVPSSIGGKRGDQIWVGSALSDRLEEYGSLSKEDLAVPAGGADYLSDHLPIWIRLEW